MLRIKHNNIERGFTMVEILIVAPIVILVIGAFVAVIVSMTGEVLAARASNNLSYSIQDALDRIEQHVKSSGGFLETNNFAFNPTSVQGFDNGIEKFKNVNSDTTRGTSLILNTYMTNENLKSTSRQIVFVADSPNACTSSLVSHNTPLISNVVYFIKRDGKNGDGPYSLWRRLVVSPKYYEGCDPNNIITVDYEPALMPSCSPYIDLSNGTNGEWCKTHDTKLVEGILDNGLVINYYTSSNSTTPVAAASDASQSDAVRKAALQTTNTVSVTINALNSVAGRDISQSGTIRVVSPNNYIIGN